MRSGSNLLNVYELVVAEHRGEASLIRYRGDDGLNVGMDFVRTDKSAGSEPVMTESLDTFCAAHGIRHIGLLKMDIKGSEAAALRAAITLLQNGVKWGSSVQKANQSL